jgi:hypothetical protein
MNAPPPLVQPLPKRKARPTKAALIKDGLAGLGQLGRSTKL